MALKVRPLLAAFLPLGCLRALAARVLLGARLGRGVRLALGAYLDASSTTLGDDVHLGRFTSVKPWTNSLKRTTNRPPCSNGKKNHQAEAARK